MKLTDGQLLKNHYRGISPTNEGDAKRVKRMLAILHKKHEGE